jgi:LPXTG-motif cell wall anchor domain protein
MKKIVTSFIILIIAILMYQTVYATENSTGASVVFNFSGDSKVTQGTKTVTYTISLGDFVGIPENSMMGYEAVLEYDSNVFDSATIEGLNDWTAQYTESTKRLIGETRTKGEANKDIAKITLTLKDDAPAGNTTVKLNNVLLTANGNQEFSYTKEATLQIEAKAEEPKKDDENNTTENTNTNQSATQNESKNQTNSNTQNSVANNTSNEFKSITKNGTSNNSKASSVLPKTGTGRIALAVFMILIIGIGCLIRYKSIQTK